MGVMVEKSRQDRFLPRLVKRDWFGLAAVIVAFVGLVSLSIDKFSVWFDEAFGAYMVQFDFKQIAYYTEHDVHPPMYYWILKVWVDTFGGSVLSMRLMSLVIAVIALVAIFLFVHRVFGRKAAFWSVIFVGLSPVMVHYAGDARMYPLVLLDAVLATYVLYYADKTNKTWAWVLYGALVAFGLWTQYLTALIFVAHWVWRIVTPIVNRQGFVKWAKYVLHPRWVGSYFVALLLFSPWIEHLKAQYTDLKTNGFWVPSVSPKTLADFVADTFTYDGSDGISLVWVALIYAVILITGFVGYKTFSKYTLGKKSTLVLMSCLIIVPVLVLYLASLPPRNPMFIDRYIIESSVYIMILIAVILYGVNHKYHYAKYAVTVILLGVLSYGNINQLEIGNYNYYAGQSYDTKELVAKVAAKSYDGEPIVSLDSFVFYEANMYSTPKNPVFYFDEALEYKYGSTRMLVENDMHKIRDVDQFTSSTKRFWVIDTLLHDPPKALRSDWKQVNQIIINDDLSGRPLYKAIEFSVE